jgi:hypothetical protein
VVKCISLLGDLKIRENEDGLPKEMSRRKIPTLNRREKVISTIENYKDMQKELKEKVGKMRTKT